MANFQIKDLSSDSNPLGTDLFLKSSGNGALTKITFSDFKESLQGKTNNSLAIVASGNTHAAISAGQYVYVQDHSSLTEGLYTANSSIGTNVALSSSNLTAVSSGGFNKLKGEIDSLNSNISNLITSRNVVASFNVNANSWIDATADLTLSGYTPLGIIQIDFNNNDCYAMKYSTYANTLYIRVHNNSATAHPDAKCTVRVLYLKS